MKIFTELVEGLKEIHDHKQIHKGLKPGNVLLTQRNGVKITDFGLSVGILMKVAERITRENGPEDF